MSPEAPTPGPEGHFPGASDLSQSHTVPIVPSRLRDPVCGEQPSFTTQDERDRQDTIQSLANVTTCYYAAGSSAYFLSQTLCDTEWQELYSLNIFRTRAAGLTSGPATVGWGHSVYGCLARLRLPPTKTSSAARAQVHGTTCPSDAATGRL